MFTATLIGNFLLASVKIFFFYYRRMASDDSLEATSSQVAGDNLESTIQINIKTLDSQIHTFRVGKNVGSSNFFFLITCH